MVKLTPTYEYGLGKIIGKTDNGWVLQTEFPGFDIETDIISFGTPLDKQIENIHLRLKKPFSTKPFCGYHASGIFKDAMEFEDWDNPYLCSLCKQSLDVNLL